MKIHLCIFQTEIKQDRIFECMNKKMKKFCFASVFLSFISFTGHIDAASQDNKAFEISKNLDVFSSVYKELEMFYVDSINSATVIKNGIDAMLGKLDPYNQYMPESEKDDFKAMTTGEYGGIGSIIQQRGDKVIISDPYEDMPAQLNDLRPGDAILEIDGISMVGKTVSEVSEKLKGIPNTKLTIKIERKGDTEPLVKEITRKKIQLKAVPYYGMLNDSIGYIYLTNFTDKASSEVKNAFLDLKKKNNLSGVVLDLRGNPGGILEEAIQIVNFFVPKGQKVLETKGKVKNWDRTYSTTQEPLDTEIPLAVMVNRGSASASEIVAGSLQDLDRAVIVGERTFGKGLVQTTRPVPYNGMVKVTTAKYYIPSGRLIQAIDYSHRNPDGSVGRIPDSLTHEFKTANGRIVRDGGGVTPDLSIESENSSNLLYYLLKDNYIFDFANDYKAENQAISDIKDFNLNDIDYNKFVEFVKSKDFKYDRQSEKMLQDLKKIAEAEGYTEQAKQEFAALEAKLVHNIDYDLQFSRPEIQQYLEQEIAKRYYFQNGEIIQSLKYDNEVKKAIDILSDKNSYNKTLNTFVTKKKK